MNLYLLPFGLAYLVIGILIAWAMSTEGLDSDGDMTFSATCWPIIIIIMVGAAVVYYPMKLLRFIVVKCVQLLKAQEEE